MQASELLFLSQIPFTHPSAARVTMKRRYGPAIAFYLSTLIGRLGEGMRHDAQNPQRPVRRDHTSGVASRLLVVAVSLCGALAGGSIVEAIAIFASRGSSSIALDHLIAEPLALAGAICGGLLAAILASKDQWAEESSDPAATDKFAHVDVTPPEPMIWQPAPHMLPTTYPLAPLTPSTATPPTQPTRRALRTRRATRPRASRLHSRHSNVTNPSACD